MGIFINNTDKPQRENKGRSLLEAATEYVALDVETTGLDPYFDEVIEVSAVRYKDGAAVGSFTSLVKPNNEVDEFITELTGITNDMLANAPALPEVLPQLLNFVGSSVIVGHNVNFDINFIYDTVSRCNLGAFSNDFIDTMRIARLAFKGLENYRLTTLVKVFGIANIPQHRAEADCLAAAGCYEYMKTWAQQNNIKFADLLAKAQPLKASSIAATVTEFDESHPLYNKVCVFTGTLTIPRKEAMQLVVNVGGIVADGINKHTNYLIIGNNEYCTQIKDGKSNKQKKAENYILAGQDITILSEAAFFTLLES